MFDRLAIKPHAPFECSVYERAVVYGPNTGVEALELAANTREVGVDGVGLQTAVDFMHNEEGEGVGCGFEG